MCGRKLVVANTLWNVEEKWLWGIHNELWITATHPWIASLLNVSEIWIWPFASECSCVLLFPNSVVSEMWIRIHLTIEQHTLCQFPREGCRAPLAECKPPLSSLCITGNSREYTLKQRHAEYHIKAIFYQRPSKRVETNPGNRYLPELGTSTNSIHYTWTTIIDVRASTQAWINSYIIQV